MLKPKAISFLISIAVLLSALAAIDGANRDKRQAPNINVHEIPKTGFSCDDKKMGEYYADPEARCQVYHICIPGMNNKLSLISFVCPNGTIFSQATKVCTPYERVDCRLTSQFTENMNGEAGRNNYVSGDDYDNYAPPPPPRPQPQPARSSSSSRSRNTPAPPPPAPPSVATQAPPRNRFRSGSNQFRGQQVPPVTPRTTLRTTAPPQPVLPVRGAILSPARPAGPAFRSPILAARPPQSGAPLANALPARPTPRPVVSTSTSTFSYEYEYEYDYEDEQPAGDQANARSKRDIVIPEEYYDASGEKITNFTCDDKVPGAAYADVETNCEMFHICVLLGKHKILDYKVFCANGTAFDQETSTCIEKKQVACENSTMLYQYGKPNQYLPNKKALTGKDKYSKSKKPTRLNKE